MTTKGLFVPIYGQGGWHLDPVGGQRLIAQKATARGLQCRAEPYDYTDRPVIVQLIRSFHRLYPGLPIFIEGDSCGANVLQQLIADVAPVEIAGAYFIQASVFCNFNYPNIKDNCRRALVIYSDARTAGFGQFVPRPEVLPTDPNASDGEWHLANNGKTWYCTKFVPAMHPDDQDVANVHNPIFADIDKALA